VCRGCKRFAHEIVQWNGYDREQQARIWERLGRLRDEVVSQNLQVTDREAYVAASNRAGCADDAVAEAVYELLRFLVAQQCDLAEAGLRAITGAESALQILQQIDTEVYARSLAHYERNFKIPV